MYSTVTPRHLKLHKRIFALFFLQSIADTCSHVELFRTVLPLRRCNHNSCKGICPEPQNRTYFEPISPPSAVPSDQLDFLKNSKSETLDIQGFSGCQDQEKSTFLYSFKNTFKKVLFSWCKTQKSRANLNVNDSFAITI